VYPFADEPASNKRSGHDDEDLVQITANELACSVKRTTVAPRALL
jgi:hypothetical protein